MIATYITMIKGDRNVFLKVPNRFCLYTDPEKLMYPKALSADIPYFLEIQYSDEEYPDERIAYSAYGFENAKRELILDKNKKQVISKDLLKIEFLQKRKEEIECLLYSFTRKFVFSYPVIQGWFLNLEEDFSSGLKNQYGQLGYFYNFPESEPNDLYSIEHDWHLGNPIILSSDKLDKNEKQFISLTDMYEIYYNASSLIRETVFRAAKQIHSSEKLSNIDSTAKFLYHVYAIETLIGAEDKKENRKESVCETCGQKKFSVSKKFHIFLEKYSDSYNKKRVNEIYGLRSAIVHSGQPISHFGFFTFEDQLKELKKHYIQDQTLAYAKELAIESLNKFLYMNGQVRAE